MTDSKFMKNKFVISAAYSMWISLTLPFTVNAGSNLQSEVSLWALNGKKFNSLKTCSLQRDFKNKLLFVYAESSCVISELATYTLLKECINTSKIERVSILDKNSKKTYLSFDINPETCKYLTTQLDAAQSKQEAIYARTKKHYVIQFYAGNKKPAPNFGRCADIPLYQHIEDNMFYLMSETYERYSEVKQLMDSINEKCKNIDLWIRPISIIQH